MNVKSALEWAGDELGAPRSSALGRDAEILLEAAAGKKRFELFMAPGAELSDEVFRRYSRFIERRRRFVPVDYILGRTEFMSLPFNVDENVLIPRRETEILAERALKRLGPGRKMLDVGTGSGNIAVSAAYYSGCAVCASDVCPRALDSARGNAALNGVVRLIEFFEGDMFEPLKERGVKGFDAIVSNPPYVREGDMGNLQEETARYEPRLALCGGEDGLDFYRRIAYEAPYFLREEGMLLLETGYDQASAVSGMLEARGFAVEIIRDYSGIERVVEAVFKNSPAGVLKDRALPEGNAFYG